jgi:hypothetical protein
MMVGTSADLTVWRSNGDGEMEHDSMRSTSHPAGRRRRAFRRPVHLSDLPTSLWRSTPSTRNRMARLDGRSGTRIERSRAEYRRMLARQQLRSRMDAEPGG